MGFLDSIAGLFSTESLLSGTISPELGAGLGIAESLLGGQSSSAPSYSMQSYAPPAPVYQNVQAPAVYQQTGAVSQGVKLVLFQIAQTLGLRGIPTLSRAMTMIRSMSKYLAPAATAAALGIGMSDLATLIASSNRRKRRHTNPANVKALRRSMRRLGSFQKLASRVNKQLSHVGTHRRAVSRGRCNTCRKSPCSC